MRDDSAGGRIYRPHCIYSHPAPELGSCFFFGAISAHRKKRDFSPTSAGAAAELCPDGGRISAPVRPSAPCRQVLKFSYRFKFSYFLPPSAAEIFEGRTLPKNRAPLKTQSPRRSPPKTRGENTGAVKTQGCEAVKTYRASDLNHHRLTVYFPC